MNANELMIHNYVSFEGHPVCITKIGLTGIEGYLYKNDTLYDVKLKHEDIEPIPITEELLLKNGFNKEVESFFGEAISLPYYRLTLSEEVYVLAFFYKDGEFRNKYCVRNKNKLYNADISHLHQLQNLCNIAGVELELNIGKI